MRPYRWGNPDAEVDLPAAAPAALAALGVSAPTRPPVPPEQATVPASSVPAAARTALEAILGVEHVRRTTPAGSHIPAAGPHRTCCKLRAGDASDAPDAVVFPADHDEIVRRARVCARAPRRRRPVRRRHVGGRRAGRRRATGSPRVIALDVRRLDAVGRSGRGVAHRHRSAPACAAPRPRQLLGEHGLHARALPAVLRGRQHRRLRGGALGRAVVGRLRPLRRDGRRPARSRRRAARLRLGTAPMSAAGPDLRQLSSARRARSA